MISKKIKKLKSLANSQKTKRIDKTSPLNSETDAKSEEKQTRNIGVEELSGNLGNNNHHYFSNETFDKLDISANLKRALKEVMGFDRLTKIQERTIPHLLNGRNLIGAAKTGSGKTLSFLIPALENLSKVKFRHNHGTGVLVITPTRELAQQIYDVAKTLTSFEQRSVGLLIGGANRKFESIKLKKGVNVLIATPGRLLDHLTNTEGFNCKNLVSLIIDEADQILKFGFEEELNEILKKLPQERQTVLFSATMTRKIEDMIRLNINNPISINLKDESSTVSSLEQGFVICDSDTRFRLLFTFLKKNQNKKIMVFFSSCNSVKFHSDILNYVDIKALEIHGRQKQQKRINTFYEFSNLSAGVLLCTDVAARGLDIPKVDWIVQFDPPDDVKEYIHRVGRTCRGADSSGKALLILLKNELQYLKYLKAAKVELNEYEFPESKLAPVQEQFEKLVQNNYFLSAASKNAYKSYMHAYMSHSLKDVFNVRDIDQMKAAKSFGLAVPPRVNIDQHFKKRKEVKNFKREKRN